MDDKYKITSFLFSLLTIGFLRMLNDLLFLIQTLSLFHSFILYGKNVPLKDFVLVGSGFIIEAKMILVNNFLEKDNLDKHKVNDL